MITLFLRFIALLIVLGLARTYSPIKGEDVYTEIGNIVFFVVAFTILDRMISGLLKR